MLARSSSISKDPKLLLDLNRPRLKKIFSKLHPSRDGRISFVDITKFCRNAKMYPVVSTQDIVSTHDLKAMLEKIRPNYPMSSITISYLQFEQLIGRIAGLIRTEQQEDRIQKVLEHIQLHCGEQYSVCFVYSASKQSPTTSSHGDPSKSRPKGRSQDRKYSESPRIQRTSTATSSKGNSLLDFQNSPRPKLSIFSPAAKDVVSPMGTATNPRLRGSRMSLGNTSYGALSSARPRSRSKDPCLSLEDRKLSSLLLSKPSEPHCQSPSSSPTLRSLSEISQTFQAFRLKHDMIAESPARRVKPIKTQLRHYQEFVWQVRTSSFSADFVKRLVLASWRLLTQKSLHE